jgi:hypothetical protein
MNSRKNRYFSKINVSDIIFRHFKTLINANTRKTDNEDVFLFIVLPLIVAICLGLLKLTVSKEVANTLITILSIFVGLLINVIVLLFDIVKRDEEVNKIKNVVLRETLINISYTILISLVTILVALFSFIDYWYIKQIFSVIIYFLMTHIGVTLLMVIKRMYLLFLNEITEEKNS